MVLPLLPIMLGAMAVSGGANLYAQWRQRQMYSGMRNAYEGLDKGYRSYLASQGRSINPDRAWTSYFGQAQKAAANYDSSLAGSVGTAFGTFGAGIGLSGKLHNNGLFTRAGKTNRWL